MSLEPETPSEEPTPAASTAAEPTVPTTSAARAPVPSASESAAATDTAVAAQEVEAQPLSASELQKVRRIIHPGVPRRLWRAAVALTLVASMAINLILIVVVLVLVNQVGSIKMTLNAVLGQLDSAFEGLGQAVINDTIRIDQQVPVQFDLPLEQDTTVTTQAPVPINTQATFSLGQFGSINGTVSLQLPTGTRLPVHLALTVPVSNSIPVVFDQPVSIPLAEKGLGSVVAKLRSALGPIIELVQQLPDRFVIIPQ
jgi:septal ring-binding cell division protein DamX